MYAGVGTQGAEDAWYTIATQFEKMEMVGTQFCGGTVDIAKCFDQVNPRLVEDMARLAGMPSRVLNTYLRYHSSLIVHNTVAQGIGIGYVRRCGIPQGCPLSMLIIALITRPWVVIAKSHGLIPSILADDLFLLSFGDNMCTRFADMLNRTHRYLHDMGAKVAEGKSFNFASNNTASDWLKNTLWEVIGASIEVVDNFRYLGAHL